MPFWCGSVTNAVRCCIADESHATYTPVGLVGHPHRTQARPYFVNLRLQPGIKGDAEVLTCRVKPRLPLPATGWISNSSTVSSSVLVVRGLLW